MGRNTAAMGGPGTDNEESGGETITAPGRASTSTNYEKSDPGYGGGSPDDTHSGETFDTGIPDALSVPIDNDGQTVTSDHYPDGPSVNDRDTGSPGSIPDPSVINRGYLNQNTPVPEPTRVGAARQSWSENPSKHGK